jgi:hypothetical protein
MCVCVRLGIYMCMCGVCVVRCLSLHKCVCVYVVSVCVYICVCVCVCIYVCMLTCSIFTSLRMEASAAASF